MADTVLRAAAEVSRRLGAPAGAPRGAAAAEVATEVEPGDAR